MPKALLEVDSGADAVRVEEDFVLPGRKLGEQLHCHGRRLIALVAQEDSTLSREHAKTFKQGAEDSLWAAWAPIEDAVEATKPGGYLLA